MQAAGRQDHRLASGGIGLKILIVGISYEPELAGIGPCTSGVAKGFASKGHGVTVMTGVPHYPQWKRLPHGRNESHGNPAIYRYNHFIPRRHHVISRSLYELTWFLSALRALFRVDADVVV